MLTDGQRANIQALTDKELELEFAPDLASRFQRDKFDYLKVVIEQRQQEAADAAQAAELKIAQDGLAAARSGTRLATLGWLVAGVVVAALSSK